MTLRFDCGWFFTIAVRVGGLLKSWLFWLKLIVSFVHYDTSADGLRKCLVTKLNSLLNSIYVCLNALWGSLASCITVKEIQTAVQMFPEPRTERRSVRFWKDTYLQSVFKAFFKIENMWKCCSRKKELINEPHVMLQSPMWPSAVGGYQLGFMLIVQVSEKAAHAFEPLNLSLL